MSEVATNDNDSTMASPKSPLKVSIGMGSPGRKSAPDSPSKMTHLGHLTLPFPIVTRRTRTKSTSEIAFSNPEVNGEVRSFCRSKGHGFVIPEDGGEDLFVHISDIEGEYIPLEGDLVTYRLCPIPPKREKYQATHVRITNFTPEVHLRWDSSPTREKMDSPSLSHID